MRVRFWRFPRAVSLLGAVLWIGACSSSAPRPDAPAVPVGFHYDQPKSKTDPDVVEETDSYYVRRYKKSEMILVDPTHVRPLILSSDRLKLPIYRQDDKYYYIRTEKFTAEEIEAARKERESKEKEKTEARAKKEAEKDPGPQLSEADFDTIVPPRGTGGARFLKAGEGLPQGGQWRQNIAVADINGDGFLDIVASPNRVSSGSTFYLFLGDGHGNFREQEPAFVDETGKPVKTSATYGGVAVADFDGDGKPDIAVASHGGGVHVYLQRQNFQFTPMDKGLPPKFSGQAIAAVDVDGDGKTDLVVSRDQPDNVEKAEAVDMHQVRVYKNQGIRDGWKYLDSAIVGGYASNHLFPIQLDGDRSPSIVMGSIYLGGTFLPWRNDGKGNFKGFSFDAVELSAFHFGIATGHVGKDQRPAFADLYFRRGAGTNLMAAGVSIYIDSAGQWTKIPLWREKDYGSSHLVSIAMGDLDGDGLDDLVLPDFVAKRLRIFYQTSAGKFLEAPEKLEPPLKSAVCDVRLADVNGDGKLDVILAETTYSERPEDSGGFEVFLNQGK